MKRLMAAGGVLGFVTIQTAAIWLSQWHGWLVPMPFILLIGVIGASFLVLACTGRVWALLVLFSAAVFLNDATVRYRDAGDVDVDWQSALKFGIWMIALTIGAVQLQRLEPHLRRTPVAAGLGFYIVAALSSVYSVIPTYSFAAALGCIGVVLFGLVTGEILGRRRVMLATLLMLCCFLACSWGVYWTIPEIGNGLFLNEMGTFDERMIGLSGQPNTLGRTAALVIVIGYIAWRERHLPFWALALCATLAAVTLMAAESRNSMLAAGIAVTAVALRRQAYLLGPALLTVLLGATVIAFLPWSAMLDTLSMFSRSGNPQEILSMTGRLGIWEFVWGRIMESPLFGYGFTASRVIISEGYGADINLSVGDAHSMYLQVLLSVGFFGAIPLIVMFYCMIRDMMFDPDPFRDSIFLLTIIIGAVDASAFSGTPNLLTLLLFAGFGMSGPAFVAALHNRPASAIGPGGSSVSSQGK